MFVAAKIGKITSMYVFPYEFLYMLGMLIQDMLQHYIINLVTMVAIVIYAKQMLTLMLKTK